MFEPDVIVLYVENPEISARFYQKISSVNIQKCSESFHVLIFLNGVKMGLKNKDSSGMPAGDKGVELAFTAGNPEEVRKIYRDWEHKHIVMDESPAEWAFGYGFTALDPDGYRLRVVALAE